jgi:molybdopterin synthase catalytic subunit
VQILQTPLSVDDVLASVGDARAGGQVVFVGTVRDHDDGRSVTRLDYTAHPSAAAELRAVVQEAAARPGVVLASAVHRVGDLAIGDLAVVAACSAAHRAEAFEACAQLIEDLKHRVPIWKEQRFADGSSEWVAGL